MWMAHFHHKADSPHRNTLSGIWGWGLHILLAPWKHSADCKAVSSEGESSWLWFSSLLPDRGKWERMSALAVDKQRDGSRMERIGLSSNCPLRVFFSALDEEGGGDSSQIFTWSPGTPRGGHHNMEASSLGIYWFSAYKRKSCLTMKVVSVIFAPRYSKKNRNEQSEYESRAGEVASWTKSLHTTVRIWIRVPRTHRRLAWYYTPPVPVCLWWGEKGECPRNLGQLAWHPWSQKHRCCIKQSGR